MATEIERKFLVKNPPLYLAEKKVNIKQGYIVSNKEKVIRVRIEENSFFLTIKGRQTGISRLEYDFPISENDADELITHFCNDKIIEKTRYYVKHGEHLWEVDEFHKKNTGLIVAEIELKSEDEIFEPPSWIMQEVTSIGKYYNMNLATNPYESW